MEENDYPMRWAICGNCDGEGRHIHDAFREDTFSVYDAERAGLDFEVPDTRLMTDEEIEDYEAYCQAEAEYAAERAAERKMGA